jgi:hypothetical protein
MVFQRRSTKSLKLSHSHLINNGKKLLDYSRKARKNCFFRKKRRFVITPPIPNIKPPKYNQPNRRQCQHSFLKAYEYIVNGKSALEWIIERYCFKTDKDSGITNDANDWGLETENNPKYPLELFQRIITVSLETMKIVKGLPDLEV